MPARVTMQDIADALGLSRNTVSKAINNTGVIAENTKELILRKAAEMGYRNISVMNGPADNAPRSSAGMIAADRREIAMLTLVMPGGSHFAVTTLDRMQQILTSRGYSLAFYRVTPEEQQARRLPGSFNLREAAAVFCMELFDYDYCRMLSGLGIPLLLIDSPAHPGREPLAADTLMMENQAGIFSFVTQIAKQGKRSVGFVGNINHCTSFLERGSACIAAAALNGLPPVERYSILAFPPGSVSGRPSKYADYAEYLYEKLREMPELPEVFVCANDFIAINLIGSLRRMGLQCPGDVLVMGFDDSPESRFHAPTLTTVHIHTQIMGNLAAEMILSRIADPSRELRTTYAPTDLILRESSRF